eukprot:TRINITY_DN3499_c0_g1_i5.p1 TRINITY_DN3499_c0_g1~~TRINITY_DN3499_c0_g1_i5.p1  ORF type:complete len:479 (-),score=27.40 TRINITY_DN3499_c0_g1_i5:56-1462(-)
MFQTCKNSFLYSNKTILYQCLRRQISTSYQLNTRKPTRKEKNIKYLKRGSQFFNPDESEIPVFKYANERPEKNERIYMMGNAAFGQLGQQGLLEPKSKKRFATTQMHKPFRISFGEYEDVREVSCGYGFTVFSTRSAKNPVFGTGFNQDGQIGYHERRRGHPLETIIQPATMNLTLPEKVYVKKVACGRAHTLLLCSDGSIKTLGNNAYGQAGRKIIENEDYSRNRLINDIELDHKISDVTAGQDHSILITEEGQVMSAGWGADGQTGLGHYDNQAKFALVEGDIKGEKIKKVACRADNVLALNDKGEIFGWGNSEYGQFREITEEQQINTPTHFPTDIGKIVDIASGGTVCLAVNEEGEVFVWGYGILGKGPKLTSAFKPEKIPSTLFGRNDFSPDTRVEAVFAGMDHQAALNSIGDLYVWGKNRNKCLGLGDQGDQFFPMKVAIGGRVTKVSLGVDHTAIIATAWS